MTNSVVDELENPIWNALGGAQHLLGVCGELAGCLDPAVGPFAAFHEPTVRAFEQLIALGGRGRSFAFVTAEPIEPVTGWEAVAQDTLEEFVCPAPIDLPPPAQLMELGEADVADMLALAASTTPGPFESETFRFGRYIGCRTDGELTAMAGERFHLSAATEISAVCTTVSHRGEGLGGRMVAVLANAILRSRKLPFLHVRTGNVSAIRLY